MKTYEELSGGEGRRIFFRAERFRAQELFRRNMPTLVLDQTPLSLADISVSGFAAVSRPSSNQLYEPESEVNVQLALGDQSLFESRGEIARIEPTPSGTKIGVRFLDRSFNMREVVDNYNRLALRQEVESFGAFRPGEGVSAEYRALCADILQLLRAYRQGLDQAEQNGLSDAAAAELLEISEQRIMPQWRELWFRANALVEGVMDDPRALEATKRYTELVLTPEFNAGAIWRRSYEKPLGYPGDYQIMNMVYDWQRVGTSLYEKLVHRLGLEVAECIATRMVIMRQEIARLALAQTDGPLRVTNLGCGSGREIIDYLKLRELPRPVHFTLIDQDQGALESLYAATHPDVIRLHKQVKVRCLHSSFAQIMRTQELFGTIGQQDLVYSVGLVDYLHARRARIWAHSLYKFIAPGGRLVISNMMKTPESNLWPMEFLTDWNIIYRDHDEMLALAEGLPNARASTRLDPTGRVVMLTIEKLA